jgi:ABC-type multidrug transport system ATPase subunit
MAEAPRPAKKSEPAIRIQKLTKKFPRVLALDRVTFDVPEHSIFGLVGPNGAGKTTLFSLVAGFLKPTQGHIEVLGIDVENISALRGRLSILPQDALFQTNVPILEQLTFFSRLNGMNAADAREEALRSLRIVGLEDQARRNPRVLSHGMAKRLGIAQAFLGDPEVVILDEPTSGLDPANAKSIRQLVRELQHTGTVVISSHNLREIQEICTHVAIIDRGELVECKDIESITQATRQVRMSFSREMTDEERKTVLGVAGVTSLTYNRDENEYVIHLDLKKTPRPQDQVVAEIVQKLLSSGLVPKSINEGASLEARFLEVTGDDNPDEVERYRKPDDRIRGS